MENDGDVSVNDELLKMAEVARILNCSKDHVYNLAASGKLPTMRTGRALRTSRAHLTKWIAEQHANREG
jgi:excisionase family DNA binding protein